MCRNIIWLFGIIALFIDDNRAITNQTLSKDDRKIKNSILNERKDCKIEESEPILNYHFEFNDCEERILPVHSNSYFRIRSNILCVAYYDVLNGLCEIYGDKYPQSLQEISDTTLSNKVCNFSAQLYSQINWEHESIDMNEWSNYVKNSLSNYSVCLNLCVFNEKVDPKCTIVLNLINHYLEAKSKVSTSQNIKINLAGASKVETLQTKNKEISTVLLHQDGALNVDKPGALNVDKPNTKLEQYNNTIEIKLQNSSKQDVNIAALNNNSEAGKEKNIPVEPAVQEKLPDEHSLINKVNPVSSTTSSLPTQQEEKESNIQHIPNDMSRPDEDSALEGFDAPQDLLPPSSEKEFQAMPVDEDTKQEDKFGEFENEGSKQGSPLNSNDQETDIMPGGGEYIRDNFKEAEDSNFFAYFLVMTGGCIVVYVLFHNRNKLLALALEGRKGRSARSRGGRHSSASYSKLHSNLEEAIASNTTTPSATNVLY